MFIYSVITQKKVFQSFLSQLSFVNANSAALMFLALLPPILSILKRFYLMLINKSHPPQVMLDSSFSKIRVFEVN